MSEELKPCPFCGTGVGTPLTDANASAGWSGDAVCVDAEFARKLEREVIWMKDALDYICRRLSMDIDDGSRPDQYTMQDLVRKARQIPS